MKQNMNLYTESDLWVWKTLFTRQFNNLQDKSSRVYLDSLNRMKDVLNPGEIPDFEKISSWFASRTGWQVHVVKGLIPAEEFFTLLAEKKFSASTWLRSPENLDYLEEPDMFHDVFGHIPLLADPLFSSFAQELGILAKSYAGNEEIITALQRLYWFTIEFGLVQEETPKVYGAGIISSYSETIHALSDRTKKIGFDLQMVLNKTFRTDVVQSEYIVINSFSQLVDSVKQLYSLLKDHELA